MSLRVLGQDHVAVPAVAHCFVRVSRVSFMLGLCLFSESAAMFSKAVDCGQSPMEFVTEMKRNNILIMGIGHRCVLLGAVCCGCCAKLRPAPCLDELFGSVLIAWV